MLDVNEANNDEHVKEDDVATTSDVVATTTADGLPKEMRFVRDHPKELIIGDSSEGKSRIYIGLKLAQQICAPQRKRYII